MGTETGNDLPEGALVGLEGRVGRVVSVGPALGAAAGAGVPDRSLGGGLRVGIACSRFNGALTLGLLDGALGALDALGVDRNDVTVAWAPGAFELPLLARALVAAGADGVVCLGAVVRGETGHYEHVAGECAAGIQRVQLDTGVPVAFGVLTTDTLAQALARVDKGREAAATAVEMARLLRAVS
ncbi:MAG: 6,7-dimethyl-8-ribityllumazine synthase [Acidimicrobiales bacterium]